MYRRLFLGIFLVLLGLVSSIIFSAWSSPSSAVDAVDIDSNRALQLAKDGQILYNAGKFDAAVEIWQKSAEAYQQVNDREGVTKSFINQSQAFQDLGLYPKACNSLLQAFRIKNPSCSQQQLNSVLNKFSLTPSSISQTEATGLRSLGEILRRQGLLAQSEKALKLSLLRFQTSPESSAALLSLGNTERAIGQQIRNRWDYEEITEIIDKKSQEVALAPYQQAFKYYTQAAKVPSAPAISIVKAQINHFQLLKENQKWWLAQTNRRIASWSRLGESQLIQRGQNFLSELESQVSQDAKILQTQIELNLANLSLSRAGIYAQINFVQDLIARKQTDRVESILSRALQQARDLQDKSAESYIIGYLGKFYDQIGNLNQAIKLTQEALVLAQSQNMTGDTRSISYLWQSQLGGLLKKKGDKKSAIIAYTSAFNTLQSLRSDLNSQNLDIQLDFTQEVKPVYIELVDLLLQTNLTAKELNSLVILNPNINQDINQNINKSSNSLDLARRVMESLQIAELDNFFQEPCFLKKNTPVQIDNIDPQAAIIYPIVLPDRLEVIISLPEKPLGKFTISTSEKEVNDSLDKLYDKLDNITVNTSARNILSTANPQPEELKENLQAILPILDNFYNWLIKPFENELDKSKIKNLVFVLNGRLQKLPLASLYNGKEYLIEKYGIALVPSLQLIDSNLSKPQRLKVLAAGVSEKVQIQEKIFPALINVPKELANIKDSFPNSQKLLNQEFTATTLEQQLKSNFPIVHLATHGLFSSNPENNFLVTGDGKSITITQLSNLLRVSESNLDLLVLSACETATGDERAVLGLAGTSVRSGARSTIATLWPVSDTSTTELMGNFYQELKNPGEKKLDALRKAQLSLLQNLRSHPPLESLQALPPHPYYWAPYVLVGNWQ